MPCVEPPVKKKAVLRAEIPRGGNLRIADRTFAGVQVAGAVGFGKVDGKNIRVCVENRLTLVPGHVKPRGVAGLEQLQSMEQRRRRERHQAVDLSVIGTVAGGAAGRRWCIIQLTPYYYN